jgi:hypothetical protein
MAHAIAVRFVYGINIAELSGDLERARNLVAYLKDLDAGKCSRL